MIAWQVPGWRICLAPSHTEAGYRHDAAETLDKAVAGALGPDPGAKAVTRVVQDRPQAVLIGEARQERAELLVAGGYGSGELPGMHLGRWRPAASTTLAPCPVTVICQSRR